MHNCPRQNRKIGTKVHGSFNIHIKIKLDLSNNVAVLGMNALIGVWRVKPLVRLAGVPISKRKIERATAREK